VWWDKKNRPTTRRNPNLVKAPPAKLKWDETMTEMKSRESGSMVSSNNQTVLGRSVVFRGDLSGDEDLLLQGQLDGTISLQDHCLTIGSTAQVKAEVRARHVIVQGSVEGNILARDKIEIQKTGRVVGDLVAATIAIEEGGYFKGSIDIVQGGSPELSRVATVPQRLNAQSDSSDGVGLRRSGESRRGAVQED
jgi:cytoskeletal protein CcmA (bactofilin family)